MRAAQHLVHHAFAEQLKGLDCTFTDLLATLDPRITATRASAAWRWTETGGFEQVSTNVMRAHAKCDHVPMTGVARGFRVEGQRVNSILFSNRPAVGRYIIITGATGTYTVGETVTATGGATGTVLSATSTLVTLAHGASTSGYSGTLTGATSGVTSTISSNSGAWIPTGNGTGSAPVLTENAGLAPDGTMTATRAVFALNGGTTINDQSSLPPAPITTTVGQPQSAAFWLRSFDGVSSYNMRFDFNGAVADANGTSSNIVVDGTWRRHEINLASASDTSRRGNLRLRGTLGTSDSADILIWNCQQGADQPFCTSEIVTTNTSVTRSRDLPQILDLTSINFSATKGSVRARLAVKGITASVNPRIWQFDDGTTNNFITAYIESSTSKIRFAVLVGGVQQCNVDSGVTVTANTFYNVACSWAANSFRLSVDGVGATEDTSGSLPTVDRLQIGKNHTSGAELNGWLQNLEYIAAQLSQSELNAWTA